ncbi:putative polysaccharide biosynthesis protein [Tepidibacillus fermentans]|uniref:PST family polysaccharide transporter n=1 Tax=Tepidibacillus fermentans TaxID=1281767 RepID=A0A4R3KAX0_9BACI|nr:oligosaccharide flippase family protein [Tepidibacillus fermentans]TCS80158.1 PST family polysaccharide transporter [Tepidibacillus fermentans]
MKEEKHKQTFVEGIAILGITGFLSKLLGAIYRIPFQNIAGDLGLAVYNKVYPLYSMVLILATAGFPVAISKIVAEHLAQQNHSGARQVLKVSIYLLSFSGLFVFLFLFFGSHTIAKLMGNPELDLAIKSVSFALLIVPIMAAIRGYFQGHQNMVPTAYSQMIEQLVRVITILVLAYLFMNNPQYGVYYAGAGATFGAFTGAVAGFIVLNIYWRKMNQQNNMNQMEFNLEDWESVWQIVRKILYYSLPVAIGSLIYPLFGIVDSFTISNLLQLMGLSLKKAENLFGVYTRAQPLIQFATFFAPSFSLALVPAISESIVRNHHKNVSEYIGTAIRFTILIGLPASVGLATLAQPINIFFYKDDAGSLSLAILAFTVMFSALAIISTGILNGLGRVFLPAKYLLIAVLVKLVLNTALIPIFGIHGAAFSTVFAYAFAALLNLLAIRNDYDHGIYLQFLLKIIISVFIMAIFVFFTRWSVIALLGNYLNSLRIIMAVVTFISILFGIISYFFGLLFTGAITKSELYYLPKYGPKIVYIIEKLHLLKFLKD